MERQALIFDFDGVIADTESLQVSYRKKQFAQAGLVFDVEAYKRIIGTNSQTNYSSTRIFAEAIGRPQDEELIRRETRREIMKEVRRQGPMPGVLLQLENAKAMGLYCAVGSSSDAEWVLGNLRGLGLESFFDVVVTFGPKLPPKPAPDIYLQVLERLQIKANNALVIEDSYNGLLAAHRAGIPAVAIPGKFTSEMDFSLATEILGSLTDLDLNKYFS